MASCRKISFRAMIERPMADVWMRAVAGLTLACAATTARAERAVHVDVAPGVAVTADEVAAALRLRIADAGAAVSVRVRPASDGVIAQVDERVRAVALGGRTGTDAARLIALAIADLAQVDIEATQVEVTAAPHAARVGRPRTSLELALVGSASVWSAPLAAVGLDIAAARGRWLVAAELGAGKLVDGDLHLGGGTVRLGGGVRAGRLDVRAGLVLAPVWVSNGAGDRTVLVGGGASARLRIPLAPDLRLVLAVGVDGFATRTQYTVTSAVGSMTTLSTPWLAPWGGAGAEVTW